MDPQQESGELGEQAVNELAFNTYLKYWCYPNPKDEKGSQKEICDLLILFKSTAIIISVKNYSFKGNYEKYFRSTLDKAILQIQGAERKLFANKKDVYINHPDMREAKFNPELYTHIFRIIVNLNTIPLFYPPGRLSKHGYVHIFNWDSFLRTVLELDTVPDFVNYLKVREELFSDKEALLLTGAENDWDSYTGAEFHKYMTTVQRNGKVFLMISGNELDLLADYYYNNKRFNKHFYSKEYTDINYKLDGKWEEYLSRSEVKRKKNEDRASYFIDEFVKREILYKNDKQNIEVATELLALSRFERRVLGKHFFEFAEKYKNQNGPFIARRYGKVNDLTIGYLLHGSSMADDMVLKFMEIATDGYCYWDNYQTNKIILIAFSNKLMSFKFGFIKDIVPFPKEYERSLIHDLKVLNWFQNLEKVEFNIKEYPDQ
jgi:hypothetical protein